MSFKIVVLNIGQGGGNTIDAISDSLAVIDADIVIISEFRTGLNGMVLRAHLDRMGLIYQIPCDTNPDEDAIIMASRIPFIISPAKNLPSKYQHLFFQALLGKFQIVGAHFDGVSPGDAVMAYMVKTAENLYIESAIFLGTLPTELHIDPQKDDSSYRDHIKRLKHCGLLDVRAIIRNKVKDDIDLSSNFGGSSKDYALVSPKLAHTVKAYDDAGCHIHRPCGLHEILVFEIVESSSR